MKPIFLILLSFTVLSGYAQSKISLGILTSIDRTALDPNYVSQSSKGGLGYSAGVRLRYDFNSQLSMQTGLALVSASYQHEGELVYNDSKIQYSQIPTTGPLPNYYKAKDVIQSFQIPVLFSYYFGNRFKFGLTAGTALNNVYRMNTGIIWYYDDGSEKQEGANFRVKDGNLYMSAMAGIGCEYTIGKLIVRAEPNAQYAFINHKRMMDPYWSVGLGVSTFYRF